MSRCHVVYITARDRAEALSIGRSLVEERLAACANVFDGMTSVYQWQGNVHEDSETVLICKTQEKHVDAIISQVKTLHSYDCPCVVAWPVEKGAPEYLQWLVSETSGDVS